MPIYQVHLKRTVIQVKSIFVEAEELEQLECCLDDVYEYAQDQNFDTGWEAEPGNEEGEPDDHEVLGEATLCKHADIRLNEDDEIVSTVKKAS